MNVKVHTPKNQKMGSTMKQFLLSLVATTISIVLTFGTAAWLDDKKKTVSRMPCSKRPVRTTNG